MAHFAAMDGRNIISYPKRSPKHTERSGMATMAAMDGTKIISNPNTILRNKT